MKKIVLLRHGESLWNKQNLFSGWTDVDLTSKGMEDARLMGHRLKEKNLLVLNFKNVFFKGQGPML